jgi:L-asparagine oxygenase
MSGYPQPGLARHVSRGTEVLSARRLCLSDTPTISLLPKIQKDGYAFLERFYSGISTNDLIALVGNAVALGNGGPVHQLRPRRVEEAPSNTYSGNYGLGEFPLHTDLAHWYLPPRYLLLRCVVGSAAVPTMVVDGRSIIDKMGATTLARAFMQPRRPLRGKWPLLRLYQPVENGSYMHILRWDEKYIKPATEAGARGASIFLNFLVAAPRIQVRLSQPGDTLIVDNWRMLHGRAPVPENSSNRVIERVYLGSVN